MSSHRMEKIYRVIHSSSLCKSQLGGVGVGGEGVVSMLCASAGIWTFYLESLVADQCCLSCLFLLV